MSKRKMFFHMITASLMRRRSRMFVALLAIAVGATILSGLTTIYYDVPKQMGEQFRNYGANMIFVASAESEGLTMSDVEDALKEIPDEQKVGISPYRYETLSVNEQPVIIAGTDLEETKKTSPYWYVDGAWPEDNGQILVGKEMAATLSLNVGDALTITYSQAAMENPDQPEDVDRSLNEDAVNIEYTVSGILDTGGTEESYIFMSLADMGALTKEDEKIDVVELSISASGEELDGYVKNISKKVPQITPRLVKRVTQSETTVLTKLQSLVLLVTIVVLLLMMICVATTMMAVVTERRKEIGLRKALGASNKSIVREFMGEAMLLGGSGGLIGSILGFVFAQLVSMNVFNSTITFRPLLIPITIVAAVLVTALASLIPVRNATEVDPAIVLKGE
ncbi:MAG: FtsX-like permease family protein [Lachnospiraceae bacterium]|nr:FtsX-like permease family protein [Lachnospiraceae bacterium]